VNTLFQLVERQKQVLEKMKKATSIKAALNQSSDPDWIQTSDLLLRRQLLYSAELPDLFLKKCCYGSSFKERQR
jgi:hypothetical protein